MVDPTRPLVAERYGPPTRTEAERPPRPLGDDPLAVAARRAVLVDAARAYAARRRRPRAGGLENGGPR